MNREPSVFAHARPPKRQDEGWPLGSRHERKQPRSSFLNSEGGCDGRAVFQPMNGRHHDFGRLVAVWAAWFWAINWESVAGFLASVFTLILIAEKLGVLKHVTAWGNSVWQRFKARWFRE